MPVRLTEPDQDIVNLRRRLSSLSAVDRSEMCRCAASTDPKRIEPKSIEMMPVYFQDMVQILGGFHPFMGFAAYIRSGIFLKMKLLKMKLGFA